MCMCVNLKYLFKVVSYLPLVHFDDVARRVSPHVHGWAVADEPLTAQRRVVLPQQTQHLHHDQNRNKKECLDGGRVIPGGVDPSLCMAQSYVHLWRKYVRSTNGLFHSICRCSYICLPRSPCRCVASWRRWTRHWRGPGAPPHPPPRRSRTGLCT